MEFDADSIPNDPALAPSRTFAHLVNIPISRNRMTVKRKHTKNSSGSFYTYWRNDNTGGMWMIWCLGAAEEGEGGCERLTSPSALFFSSSFCLAYSSAIRASMDANDSRVNGRNRLRSSSDCESEESDISPRA